jgi:signal transduction histidine kinase
MENSTPSLRSEISADEEARLRAEISSLRAQLDERLSSESAQELERSQKQVLDVLESMGDGFIELDKDYTVLRVKNPQLEAAGCELSTQITQNIWANIDSSRIEQVLTNLITNAIKYAPGKKVEVKAERANGMAKITLGDNGHGIASENQERIFGRFERATSASDVTGLGLGLYICRQIVQDHGGKIYVESELGHGSSFIFELPIENG